MVIFYYNDEVFKGEVSMIKNIIGGIAVGIANVIPGVSGGTMMVILGIFNRMMDAISGIFKKENPNRKEDIIFIFQADLLPHDRRRRCNPCNIFKTARSQKLHQFLFRIRTFYEVDQAGGNDVRQMTDSSGDRIMQPVVKHDR